MLGTQPHAGPIINLLGIDPVPADRALGRRAIFGIIRIGKGSTRKTMAKKTAKKTNGKVAKKTKTPSAGARKPAERNDVTDSLGVTDGAMRSVIRDAFMKRPV